MAIGLLLSQFAIPSYAASNVKPIAKNSVKSGVVQETNWAFIQGQTGGVNLPTFDIRPLLKKAVIIAVIDTGIQFNHPLLIGSIRASDGKSAATASNYGKDFSFGSEGKTTPSDSHGHGTHVAGIIRSVFPEAQIIPIKYYNPKAGEKENLESTIKALEYAISLNVDVINYSSGGAGASLEELRMLKKAEAKNILVVTAAGNFSSNIDEARNRYYPASYGLNNLISVINHDSNFEINPTSNFGAASADISAPGSRIKSSMPENRYGFLSGTSQATAFVSGVAAQIKAIYPETTPVQIKEILYKSARFQPSLKNKCKAGGGIDSQMALLIAEQKFSNKSEHLIARKSANSN